MNKRRPVPSVSPLRPHLTLQRAVVGVGVVVALSVVSLVVSLPKSLDANRQGKLVATQLAQLTGTRVLIKGGVDLALWPQPHLVVRQLEMQTGTTPFLSVQQLDLGLAWLPLLRGAPQVKSAHFIQPVLVVAEGASQAKGLELAQRALAESGIQTLSVSAGSLTLQQGGAAQTVSNLAGRVDLPTSSQLLRAGLAGEWRGMPVTISADVGAPGADGMALAELRLGLVGAETELRLGGLLGARDPKWPVQGQVEVTSSQPAALWSVIQALRGEASAEVAALPAPFRFSATIMGDWRGYDLRDLIFNAGETRGRGLARVQPGQPLAVSAAVSMDKIDLAEWGGAGAALQAGQFRFSPQLVSAFDFRIQSLQHGPLLAEAVQLKGELKDGVLTLGTGGFTLPGNSKLAITGSVDTRGARPLTDLRVGFDTVLLRDLLTAFEVPLEGGVETQALRQLRANLSLRGPWGQWQVPTFDATLDGVDVSGQMAQRESDGALDARLTLAQFDVNRYASDGVPAWVWQLPKTDLSLTIKQLKAGDQSASNVTVAALIDQRRMQIRSLDVSNLGQSQFRLTGSYAADAAQPSDLSLRLVTPDFAALRLNMPRVATFLPGALGLQMAGPAELTLRWRTQKGESSRLANLVLPEGKLDMAQTDRVEQPATWRVRAQHKELTALLPWLKPQLSVAGARLGPIDFYAEGVVLAEGQWSVRNAQGQLAGLDVVKADLELSTNGPLEWRGQVALGNANLDQFLTLASALQLTEQGSGTIDLTADKLVVGGEMLTKVGGSLRLADKAYETDQLAAQWRGGTLSFSGQATPVAGAGWQLAGAVDVKGASVSERAGPRFAVAGNMDLSSKFETNGRSLPEALANFKGEGTLSLNEANLSGVDFSAISEQVLARQATNVNELFNRYGESSLISFGGDFMAENGVVRFDRLGFATPAAMAELALDFNLPAMRLDGRGTVELRDLRDAPPVEMTLAGSLAGLGATFDTAALQAFAQTDGAVPVYAATGVAPVATRAPMLDEDGKPLRAQLPELDGGLDAAVQPPVRAVARADSETAPEAPAKRNFAKAAEPVPSVAELDAAAPAAGGSVAPPSIKELLEALPVARRAEAAEPAAPKLDAVPKITFTPASGGTKPVPKAKPAAPQFKVPDVRIAPEFSGTTMNPIRDDAIDSGYEAGGQPPSLDDLMRKMKEAQ